MCQFRINKPQMALQFTTCPLSLTLATSVGSQSTINRSINTVSDISLDINSIVTPHKLAILSLIVELIHLRRSSTTQWFYDFMNLDALKRGIDSRIDLLMRLRKDCRDDSIYTAEINKFRKFVMDAVTVDELMSGIVEYGAGLFVNDQAQVSLAVKSREKRGKSDDQKNVVTSKRVKKVLLLTQLLLTIILLVAYGYFHLF